MPSLRNEGLFHEKMSAGERSPNEGPQLRLGEGVLEEVALLNLYASLQERRSRLAAGASPLPPVQPCKLRSHERLYLCQLALRIGRELTNHPHLNPLPLRERRPTPGLKRLAGCGQDCPLTCWLDGKLAGPSATVHDGHGGLQVRAADGQHRQVASPFYGTCKLPLMLGADTRLPPGLDPRLVGDVPDQHVHVLVVDVGDVVGTEAADLALGVVAASAAAPARPTSPRPAAGARLTWRASLAEGPLPGWRTR